MEGRFCHGHFQRQHGGAFAPCAPGEIFFLRFDLHGAEQAQTAQLVGIVFHHVRIPRFLAHIPGGEPLYVFSVHFLGSTHFDAAHERRRAGPHQDIGIEFAGLAVEGVAGIRHCGQGIALPPQGFWQGIHRREQVIGGNRLANGYAGQNRGEGRRGHGFCLQPPKTHLALPVAEKLRDVGFRIVVHIGAAKAVAFARRKNEVNNNGRGVLVYLNGSKAVIIALGMQQALRAGGVGSGAPFQSQQAVWRLLGKLHKLA